MELKNITVKAQDGVDNNENYGVILVGDKVVGNYLKHVNREQQVTYEYTIDVLGKHNYAFSLSGLEYGVKEMFAEFTQNYFK